jgi:hypothetical protein
MPDYQNSKIYQIICSETGERYVGSTTQTLAQRKSQHVSKYNQWLKGKCGRTSSFRIIERGNYRIELIELFPCDSKEALFAREGHFIREIVCVNKIVAGRTGSEYYSDNCEKIRERNKQYKKENSDKIKEQHKQYKKENSDKIKEYREENREKIRERERVYYQENREKINERRRLSRAKKRAEQQEK